MWHVAPWGNRARRLPPTARQTKCVCLCQFSESPLCVQRWQTESAWLLHFVFLGVCVCAISLPGCEILDNLLLVLMTFGDETGGLRLLLVTSNAVTRPKATHWEALAEEKYNATLQCPQGRVKKKNQAVDWCVYLHTNISVIIKILEVPGYSTGHVNNLAQYFLSDKSFHWKEKLVFFLTSLPFFIQSIYTASSAHVQRCCQRPRRWRK